MARECRHLKEFCSRPYNVFCMVFGILLLIKALICALLYNNIQLLMLDWEHKELALSHHSIFLGLWKNPPVAPKLHVYIYNFTNAHEYMAGNHSKPKLQVCAFWGMISRIIPINLMVNANIDSV